MKNNNKKGILSIFVSILVFVLLSGCAVKQTYSVIDVKPEFASAGKGVVAIASHDQREYVVSGKNIPQLVGILRGGFGNPFYMTTTSGMPLADEMSVVINDALKRKGFDTTTIIVSASESISDVRKKLVAEKADKLILFQIHKWKSDTFMSIGLEYDLKITVLNKNGKVLAEKGISGKDNLGHAGMIPANAIKVRVPKAFQEKLEELFNSPDVLMALKQIE